MMDRQRFTKTFMRAVVVLGSLILLFSFSRLPADRLDFRFLLLALLTIICSRVAVPIPRISGRITVADTLIFLALLLHGGEAAILLAAIEGISSSLRISKKALTILFNAAVLAASTFLTVWVLRLWFGSLVDIAGAGFSADFAVAICVMALVQYLANTGLIAVEKSYKIGEPFWRTWKTYYLWTSVTYFAGASAAGIAAHLTNVMGFYAILATVPIIAIIYLTYQTYLKNIEASAAQAELAKCHVAELSRYINELKRSEEEREQILRREQEARAEAEAANRIKDEFLATLSHELRTPLTSIIGWAGLLRNSNLEAPVQAQALETIERSAQTQAQLIDDLLDVSRIISGKLLLNVRDADLATVVASAIDVVRPAADAKGIRIAFEADAARGMISGDRARLQQVVWNLLSNAVKFTSKGGRIEVRLAQLDSHLQLAVSDTGKGIPAEFLPHVFDRFRQADSTTTRAHGGLGLGLAIVRHLVELHGGTVHAESEGEGLGATFFATFPLTAEQWESTQTNQAYRRSEACESFSYAPALDGLRVLVVDDEDDARRVISAVIAQSGAQVRACSSAHEALEALEQWHPDVLMSDIGMPGEDGYSLIQKVRARSAASGGRIPAAALTAYAREEDRQRALAAGYQMHLAKPIISSELIATVAGLAGRCA